MYAKTVHKLAGKLKVYILNRSIGSALRQINNLVKEPISGILMRKLLKQAHGWDGLPGTGKSTALI